MFFFFDLEVPAKTLNVCFKRLIFISQFRVEVLMEVQVTLHISNLSVPEVQFTALLVVVLLH